MTKETFHKFLKLATANGVSDIHLREGEPPFFRMKGGLKKIKADILTKEDMLVICGVIIPDKGVLKGIETLKEYDGSYQYGKILVKNSPFAAQISACFTALVLILCNQASFRPFRQKNVI